MRLCASCACPGTRDGLFRSHCGLSQQESFPCRLRQLGAFGPLRGHILSRHELSIGFSHPAMCPFCHSSEPSKLSRPRHVLPPWFSPTGSLCRCRASGGAGAYSREWDWNTQAIAVELQPWRSPSGNGREPSCTCSCSSPSCLQDLTPDKSVIRPRRTSTPPTRSCRP